MGFGGCSWLILAALGGGVLGCAYSNEVTTSAGANGGSGGEAVSSGGAGGDAPASTSGGADGGGPPSTGGAGATGGAGGCDGAPPCTPGACVTSCGTQGSLSCADPCEPLCVAPSEACNAIDDDCNTSCDEGPLGGCRVAVHRAYGAGGHLFSTDLAEASGWGTLEAQNNFYLYGASNAAVTPLYRCSKGGTPNTLLTTNAACEGLGAQLSVVGYLANTASCGGVPIYRLYFPNQHWHFYTLSDAEVQSAVAGGWVSEGVAGYVWTAP